MVQAVAIVPTVYGIETHYSLGSYSLNNELQQHLPFTVLKHITFIVANIIINDFVATAPTVYGIET